jgi:hypothetical protein
LDKINELGKRASSILAISALLSLVWGGLTATFIFVGTLVASYYSEPAFDYLRENLGINALQLEVDRAHGKDGILETEPYSSYASEPVFRNEDVKLNYLLRRTLKGVDCVVMSAIPVFADESNIPIPGKVLSGLQQIGREWQQVSPIVRPPMDPSGTGETLLKDGRIKVYLELMYNCYGTTVPDRTDTIIYQQLPVRG